MNYTKEQFQAVLDERKEIVERIGSENTVLRQRNYALKAAVKRLLDESWNGPIDAEHPSRTYAANLLANVKEHAPPLAGASVETGGDA